MRKSRAAWEREPALRIASSSSIFPGPTCACLAKSIRTCGARLSMGIAFTGCARRAVGRSQASCREFAHEGDHIPDGCIVQSLAPGGHGAHFDTVFDDPERALRLQQLALGQVRRTRIHSYA